MNKSERERKSKDRTGDEEEEAFGGQNTVDFLKDKDNDYTPGYKSCTNRKSLGDRV